MAKPWFRLYAEFASDPKVQLLDFGDQRHYIVLLCLKCNGTLDSTAKSPEHRERLIARALGLDPITAAEVRRRLDEAGLIAPDWQPLKWDDRQYESDTSAARMHRFRQRQRDKKRHGDVTVTDKIRSEQNREEGAQHARARAEKAYNALIRTDGAERDATTQKAIEKIGGWSVIRMRTLFNELAIRSQFLSAHMDAQKSSTTTE